MRAAAVVLLSTVALALPAAPAAARPFTADPSSQVAGNPAERFAGRVIEAPRRYFDEVPNRCAKAKRSGVDRFVQWLAKNHPSARRRVGSRYRCEDLGAAGYSFHSDNRALDIGLDTRKRSQRRLADLLIGRLAAADSTGETGALARRMGVLEIIYDCWYWSQTGGWTRYFLCGQGAGRTAEHRDHVHLSFTRDGAAKRTSFWKPVESLAPAPAPVPEEQAPEEPE